MRAAIAVLRLELHERRLVLPVGLAIAATPWILPHVPGMTHLGTAELRAASSLLIGLAFAFGGAALFGASLLGPDLSSGRLSFPLTRPVTSGALLGGRLAAAVALLGGTGALVFVPAIIGSGGVAPVLRDVPLWVVAPAALLVLLASNAASVALRSRSRWLAVDGVLLPISVVVVWLAGRRLFAAGAEAFLSAAVCVLALVVLAALLVAARAQIELGRTDRLRAHGALSLTLWAITLPAIVAFDGVSRWAVSPPPGALRFRWVREAAPTGGWVALTGTAASRLGMRATFLFDAESGRMLRIDRDASTAFSADGRRALVQRAQVGTSRKPLPIQVAELAATKPYLRELGVKVPADGWAPLALSDDGSRAAILAGGMLQLVDVESGRVLAAARTDAIERETRLRFLGPDRVLLFPGIYPRRTPREERALPPAAKVSLPLFVFDAARGLERTGSLEATTPSAFQPSRDGTRLLESEGSVPRMTVRDARTGAVLPGCTFEGFSRGAFLFDGRAALTASRAGSPKLAIIGADCRVEREVPLPPTRFLSVAGEPAPGVVSVASFHGAAATPAVSMLLVELASGAVKEVPGLRPARTPWIDAPAPAAPGSTASRLCEDASGALVLLDPAAAAPKRVMPAAPR